MTTNARISHKNCDHPKTLAARNACRERRRMDDKGKICCTCEEYKTFDQFDRDSSMPSGYRRQCKDCHQAAQWKGRYGITREEYDELLEAQGNSCWICGSEDPGDPSFNVDHCHQGEVVRGLLCRSDNVHTVPGFERLISMGLDPVAAIERYLAQPRIWGKYTPNAYWSKGRQQWQLKKKFRAQVMAEHDGTCDLCGAEEPGGRGWQVDHDHLTDEIRGVTCWPCNSRVMSGVDRLLKMGISLDRVVEYLNQDAGISTAGTRAKKNVAYSKSDRAKELNRASRRRRYARKRAEEAS